MTCQGHLLRYVVAEGGSKRPVLISNLHVEGDVFLLAFNDVPTFVQYLIILKTPIQTILKSKLSQTLI